MVSNSGSLLWSALKGATAVFVTTLVLAAGSVVPAQSRIKVLLVTGQSNRYHNWEVSSPIVKRQLEDSGRFAVTVATTPPKGTEPNQDMSSFAPKFSDYQAVVLDYEGFEFALPVKQAFVDYVKNGGGLVVLHAADNAFPGWAEFNEMIGVGGWGGFTPGYASRTQAAGPKIRWRAGGLVLDYEGFEFAPPVKQAFVDYVKNGGGLVVLHAADNAFPAWAEYNEMIAVGGWGGFTPGYANRTQAFGPKIRWRDGAMVLDNDTPGTAQHPNPHDYLMTVRAPEHPIMKGLPAMWMHANDELYSNLRGPARNVTILATATAPTSMPNGTGENEPVVMAIAYGKGRVFHDTLGHVGTTQKEPIVPMNSVDYIVLLQRGTEWAATGAVTIPVPRDFPTADKTSVR